MRIYFKLIMSLAMFPLFFSPVRLSLLPDSIRTYNAEGNARVFVYAALPEHSGT
jgi:hypothetical protein